MESLAEFEAGAVRCLFARAPAEAIQSLLERGASWPDGERMVVCEVDLTRPVAGMIDDLVSSLARAGLAVWPDWYGQPQFFASYQEASLQHVLDGIAATRAAGHQRSVLRPWLVRAIPLCRAGQWPIVADFSATIQLQQIALALAEKDLLLIVRVKQVDDPESAGLLSFARHLEWLAHQVGARVLAVLPVDWMGRSELDAISWKSQSIDLIESIAAEAVSLQDEPPRLVNPIRGRPHPNSPGEQLIAERLERDSLLGPLFQFNRPVITVRESRYLVDLVWDEGKLVVEIDGYRCHSSRSEFASDRHRDYELQLSGYLVLRIPHDSVMTDPELAIDKIRDLVKLRQRTANGGST